MVQYYFIDNAWFFKLSSNCLNSWLQAAGIDKNYSFCCNLRSEKKCQNLISFWHTYQWLGTYDLDSGSFCWLVVKLPCVVPISDVFSQGTVKQDWFLGHNSHPGSNPGHIQRLNVMTINILEVNKDIIIFSLILFFCRRQDLQTGLLSTIQKIKLIQRKLWNSVHKPCSSEN
jgi:hypothetical protein